MHDECTKDGGYIKPWMKRMKATCGIITDTYCNGVTDVQDTL